MRLRLFIDYWNFQLNWNDKSGRKQCDWKKLPVALAEQTQAIVGTLLPTPLTLEETRIYASYEPGREDKLRNWFVTFLDRQPGVRVFHTERHWRKKSIHCRGCGNSITQ